VSRPVPATLLALARALEVAAALVEALARRLEAWRAARVARAANRAILDAMSDHELADIGLRCGSHDAADAAGRTRDLRL